MFSKIRIGWIILFLITGLTACRMGTGGPSPLVTTVPVQTFTPAIAQATLTASPLPPTQTPTPTETPEPSATPTSTAIPSATPDPALAEVKLLGLSWLQPGYKLLLSINFPGPVDPKNYRVLIEEEEEYECQVLAQYPNRLYCLGRGRNVYGRILVQIFPAGSDLPGFEGKISVPYFPSK